MPSRRFANSALAGLVALILAFHSPLAAQSVEEFIGTLTVVWRDAAPAPGRGAAAIAAGEDRIYLLWDERSGSALEVEIGDATLRAAGGIRAIDRRRVRITGVRQEAAAAAAGLPEAMGRLRAIIVQPLSAPAGATPAGAPQYGAKPYITVLCQFPDQPPPLFGKAHYDSLMVGTVYPGLDHYWREVSAGQANLAGSAVVGWYVLPRPMSAYFQTTGTESPNLDLLTSDCTGVADAVVDFSRYLGVNLQVSAYMSFSWGGTGWLSRDGGGRVVPMTWLASWADQHVYGHEIGHSFGLPHSSGPYGYVYDSKWDIMSDRSFWDSRIAQWVGDHTIAWHKELVGWIAPARKFQPTAGQADLIRLSRTALPSTSGYLMVEVPISSDQFYTIEARRKNGYDIGVPLEGVLLHRVDQYTAYVVDTDQNGNVNDAGAIWTVGETFRDEGIGLSVRVLSMDEDSYEVVVALDAALPVLTVVVEGDGRVRSAPAGIDCPGDCATAGNETIELTATPGAGSAFVDWSGGLCGDEGPTCRFTLGEETTVSARFLPVVAVVGETARPIGFATHPYADTLAAVGGDGRFRWSLRAGTLPPGLALSETGILSGTPTEAGTFLFTARAHSATLTAEREFAVLIHPALVVATASTLPPVFMGESRSDTLLTNAPVPASVRWSTPPAGLPPGVSLTPQGVLTGEYRSAGRYRFAVEAVYQNSVVTTAEIELEVKKPEIALQKVMDVLFKKAGVAFTAGEARFLDLLGNDNRRFDIGDVRAWLTDTGQAALAAELAAAAAPAPAAKEEN